MRRVVGLLLLTVASTAAGEATSRAQEVLEGLPEAAVRRLLEDGSVVLSEMLEPASAPDGYVHALVIFDKPLSQTFDLLAQTGRQAEFRPEVRRIRPIERGIGHSLDEHHLRILFVNLVYRLRYRMDPAAARITWALDPGFRNDLRRVEGFWELYALDDARTLARFATAVDVGPLLPSFVQDRVTRSNLPGTIERCRRWVGAGGGAHWGVRSQAER